MNNNLGKIIGVLGGGQLGRMLIQQSIDFNARFHVLDPAENAPCRHLCEKFTVGNLLDFDTVYQFGKECDIITIEIEHVNVEALQQLANEGKTLIPDPKALAIIQDKGLQKTFYAENEIPTASFCLINDKNELRQHLDLLPAFLKTRKLGYDGKGVMPIRDENDIEKAFEQASVLEQKADVKTEISVIVAKSLDGETKAFPAVELVFDPVYNLVDYLISPARLSNQQEKTAQEIALAVVNKLHSAGIFAVEMFLTQSGEIWVNEIAPRPHNSGHQSIEANVCSQYEMLNRILLHLPLGDTKTTSMSLMLNIIGSDGFSGNAVYEGLDEVMKLSGVYVHLYGKEQTQPGRKMGHVSLLGETVQELIDKMNFIKKHLKVKA